MMEFGHKTLLDAYKNKGFNVHESQGPWLYIASTGVFAGFSMVLVSRICVPHTPFVNVSFWNTLLVRKALLYPFH